MADDFKDTVEDIVEKAKKFAKEAGKSAVELAQVIGDKTGDVIDAAKKKVEIEKLEYALNKKYRELGKACYAKSQGCTETDTAPIIEEVKALCDALDILNAEEPEECEEAGCCCCGEGKEASSCCEGTEEEKPAE